MTLGDDPSNGWEAVAPEFMAARSNIGVETVRTWARLLLPGATVLDLGCGTGTPISETLMEAGHAVYGVDASATLAAAFHRRFPDAPIACESVEASPFFERTFDGVIAVGLMFLLPASVQTELIRRVAGALEPGGRFLFSAPVQTCGWADELTGRASLSLGADTYRQTLAAAGFAMDDGYTDEGENHYFSAIRL